MCLESEKEIDILKSVMKDYVQMERDLEDFMNSVEDVTHQVLHFLHDLPKL